MILDEILNGTTSHLLRVEMVWWAALAANNLKGLEIIKNA